MSAIPRDVDEFTELLQRGETLPYTLTLSRSGDAGQGWVVETTNLILEDPDGLTVSRHGLNLHIHRGDQDILRRTADGVWAFNYDDSIPTFSRSTRVTAPGGLYAFIDDPLTWIDVTDLDMREMDVSEVLGRETLTVPVDDITLKVDTQHGVVLGYEAGALRIEATTVDFPDSLESPFWPGEVREGEQVEQVEQTQALPELPEAPTGPRQLRIDFDEMALEGERPGWEPGDSLRWDLCFNLGEPPYPGLTTTRRGFLSPRPSDHRRTRWSYLFRSEGWSAVVYSDTPLPREAELTGFFSAFGRFGNFQNENVSTDFRIEAVHHHPRGVIVDATLDAAKPPPLPENDESGLLVDGDTIWISDSQVPIVRQYGLDNGQLLHTVRIPTKAVRVTLTEGPSVVAEGKRWSLPSLEELSPIEPEPTPVFPDGWLVDKHLDDDLFELMLLRENDTLIGIGTTKPLQITALTTGYSIRSAYRLADRIYVSFWQSSIVLDFELNIISSQDVPAEAASILVSPETRRGPYMEFRIDNTALKYVDRVTGNEVTRIEVGGASKLEGVHADETSIVVVGWSSQNDRRIARYLASWTSDAGWRIVDRQQ